MLTTREVYLKGWSGLDAPERARGALGLLELEDAGWMRRSEPVASPNWLDEISQELLASDGRGIDARFARDRGFCF